MDYNNRNIFLEISHTKCGEKASPMSETSFPASFSA